MRLKLNPPMLLPGRLLLFFALAGCQSTGLLAAPAMAVLQEDFDAALPGDFAAALLAHDHIELARGQGVAGSNAIRVFYQGNARGSERVIVNYPLPPATAYSLSFAVRFCPGFDFARGGKLHGLGSARPVAGGNRVAPTRWSARGMFRAQGGLQSYIYSQNKQTRYGEVQIARDFQFLADRYYRVTLQVKLNEPERANGFMRMLVDDETLVMHRDIQFRSSDAEDGWISTLMFNTFHGGHSPDWAPRNAEGGYARECAYFDDFVVAPLVEQ